MTKQKHDNKKVLVGMSGGVDSSVTVALLVEKGYEVIGAFMKNWSGDVNGPAKKTDPDAEYTECGWRKERRDAMRVAAKLGIPFKTFDFESAYRERVMEYMFREYEAGRTPNPDVMCNKHVKFDLFMREADRLGCDFVATGHYARTDRTTYDRIRILAGVDENKDQTYFLWAIDSAVLPRVLFPIGGMTKPQVREKATALGLHTADKKDSTGICFVGEVEMKQFLLNRIKCKTGPIVDAKGKKIGKHDGVAFYTIGQRKGVPLPGGTNEPLYVIEKQPETNTLVMGSNFHPKLHRDNVTATKANWFHCPKITPFDCTARIRHRQPRFGCTIQSIDDGEVHVKYKTPQRAVTPGQSIVFYDGEEMIGGAIIDDVR